MVDSFLHTRVFVSHDASAFCKVSFSFMLHLFSIYLLVKKCLQVPIQDDGHSCGWRLVANAYRLVKYLYLNKNKNITIRNKLNNIESLRFNATITIIKFFFAVLTGLLQ